MGDVHVGDIGDRTSHIPCQKSLCITNSKVKCIPEVPTQQSAGTFHAISLCLSLLSTNIDRKSPCMPRSASKEVGPCRSPPIRINHDPQPPAQTSPQLPPSFGYSPQLSAFRTSISHRPCPFSFHSIPITSVPFHLIDPSPQELNK